MNFSKRIAAVALCAGGAFAGAAQAADVGWYVTAFGGEASAGNVEQAALDQQLLDFFGLAGLGVVEATTSLDDSDTGFGAGVGFQVNEHFAAELAYVDLGETSYDATGTVTDGISNFPADFALSQSAEGPVFSLLGFLPVGERFAVFGRAGIALMSVDADVAVSIDGEPAAAEASTTRSNGVYGLGVEYSMSNRFGLRLAWDRYAGVGDEELMDDIDVDLFTLAVRYNFD
jgi:OOP family OmpA-OmpF porin